MRKPRHLQKGATYHVTARVNRKELLLNTAESKELFLSILKRAKRRYAFRIENFCIMGNHFHLLITPALGENLSSIMQWIMSVFAMAYNRIHGLCGHFWGERFFSYIISTIKKLIKIFHYIDDNPVRAKQVENKFDWPYGGLWHQRTGRYDIVEPAPDWLLAPFSDRSPLDVSLPPVDFN